ncbi:hypothetical protein MMC28_011419, partial [Mycoblastus sanguinarius]|nr:hypothetical protein [Mycoblastus sanguinarius]
MSMSINEVLLDRRPSWKLREEVVLLLIEKGADVNARSHFYVNALIAAAYYKRESTVRLFLEHGARFHPVDWLEQRYRFSDAQIERPNRAYDRTKGKSREEIFKVLL